MEITTLCTIVASLGVIPNRSQFFLYESLSLSCGEPENSSEWSVKRNTSKYMNQECSITWGHKNQSRCFIGDVHSLDSGVYWCEFGAGECSEAVNISVTGGSVILDSPVLPVKEGEAVTLRCVNRATTSSSSSTSSSFTSSSFTSSSNLTAEFYKDGLFIRSSSTGNMTIQHVFKSDEGLYKCIFGTEESRVSWLAVRAGRPESAHSPLEHILLPVVGVCLLLASVMLLCLWKRHKGKTDPDVSYTDVTIRQEVQPKSDREMDETSTFYSTIKPGAT